jgi:hypothetical protein
MEISGKVKRVLYPRHFFYDAERAGFILVLDGTGELTKCVGVTAPIVGGARLRLTGEYLEAANERTFSFDALERTIETDDDFEKVILNAFGESIGASVIAGLGGIRPTVAALEAEDEAKICSVRGVKKAKYASALSSYKSVMAISKANAGLRKLGMSSVEIAKSVRMLGNDAAKTVSSNPYVLCIRKIASWERADEIASGNGVDPNDPRRIATAVSVFLERLAERCGDVCCKAEEVVSGAHALLGPVDSGIIRAVCNKLAADGLLVADKATGMVFGKTAWEQRMSIKGFLDRQKDKPSPYGLTRARIEEEISDYEKDHFKLDDEQKEAVIASAQSMISVITGGPGTGKTTVLDCFLHVMSKVLSIQGEAALCAPTGKAAVRMEQSTHLKASTIHTLLSVRPGTEDLTSFMYNEGNKLCFRLLVVDESSMIDWFLGSSLLKATKAGTMIVFVGDVRQLHPVGAGFFFRDIIEYGAKASYLSKTHRQAGRIHGDHFLEGDAGQSLRRLCAQAQKSLVRRASGSEKGLFLQDASVRRQDSGDCDDLSGIHQKIPDRGRDRTDSDQQGGLRRRCHQQGYRGRSSPQGQEGACHLSQRQSVHSGGSSDSGQEQQQARRGQRTARVRKEDRLRFEDDDCIVRRVQGYHLRFREHRPAEPRLLHNRAQEPGIRMAVRHSGLGSGADVCEQRACLHRPDEGQEIVRRPRHRKRLYSRCQPKGTKGQKLFLRKEGKPSFFFRPFGLGPRVAMMVDWMRKNKASFRKEKTCQRQKRKQRRLCSNS